jgi:hypothetical protein
MKKILSAMLILGFASGVASAELKKGHECPLAKMKNCNKMCPEKMKGVETVAVNIAAGVEITMTAKDKETIAKAQELALVHYNSKETMDPNCPGRVEAKRSEETLREKSRQGQVYLPHGLRYLR